MDALGARLRRFRKARGRTLAEVAAETGLSVSFLSDIERGRTNPSLDTLGKLARVYELNMSQLLQEEAASQEGEEPGSEGWEQFLQEHPDVDPEVADLLRRIERRAEKRARSAEDWNSMYYTLRMLLRK